MAAGLLSCQPVAAAELPVIPRPLAERPWAGDGATITPGATVFALSGVDAAEVEFYRAELGRVLDHEIGIAENADAATIRFGDAAPSDDWPFVPAGEGYMMRVGDGAVTVLAKDSAGRFYGLQSMLQMLEQAAPDETGARTLAGVEVMDRPRFGYRGFMLDESRHFSGFDAVKRLLDGMARYKLNRFHWHLTDSPGWRIEIKAYPELTRIGGRGSETNRDPDQPAQYYTQDQIREIIAYAAQRHIVVIPEIDMPGHADAAVRAYPEHDGGGYQKWPNFTFNPARAETLEFLETILREVAALFPDAGIIHFGGDEVHFGWHQWPNLPEVQELKKRENLDDLQGVEAWFNRRMAAFINSLGFKTGGWDEITARDLPTDKTVIYWWRHDRRDVLDTALERGYPVVLCPRLPTYFDFVQHESHKTGRRWSGGYNPLPNVYQFPAGLELTEAQESRVIGIQACLWTEAAVTRARRDFLTWPRLIALAEAAWTPEERKDFASFEHRLRPQFAWLDARGIGYYDPFENSPEISDIGAQPEYLDMPE